MTTIKPYYLKNGERCYLFKIYLGVNPLTGKPDYTTRRSFRTKKEAELAIARMKLEISNGTFRKQRVETYQDLYDLWILQYKKTVEESTFVKTKGIFRNHILPALGTYKITKMNYDVCQRHVNEWAEKLKAVRKVRSYASLVIDDAIKRDYIQSNPFALVDVPRSPKNVQHDEEKPENFYTKEQLIKFLQCMKQEPNLKAYALFLLLAYSGMRKGEAIALNWNDINFSKNEIRIVKALSRGEDSRLYIKDTKNKDKRTIRMDSTTMAVLKEWKTQQRKDLLVSGHNTLQPKQLVFSNQQNKYLQPTITRKWLVHVLKKYDLPVITTHGFRHTHCSLLFEAGANVKQAQDRLGHSDAKTTMNIYTHLSAQAKDEAIEKFTNYLSM